MAGMILVGACASSREESVPLASSDAASSLYVRRIAPFGVRDLTGTAYDQPFLGGLNVPPPQFVDIDADGDQDLFVQEMSGAVMFFEQTGTPAAPRYEWRTDRYAGIDVGEWYRFVDMDADGDLDLFAEQRYSYIQVFRNDGTPQQAAFSLVADTLKGADGLPVFSDRQNIPNFTDIDCDGKLDLFIGRVTGTVMRYEAEDVGTDGIPRFVLQTERFEDIEIIGQVLGSRHGANTLTFGDLDGDGDKDLLWGDFFEPGLLLVRNTGTCNRPVLRGEPTPFPRNDPVNTSGYNAPTVADVDADGDLDLAMGVLGGAFNANTTISDNLYYLEQTSDDAFTLRTRRLIKQIDVGSESIPAFADLDADGDQDLLLANKITPYDFQTGRVYRFENQGSATKPSFQLVDSLDIAPTFHYAPALADLDADGDLDMLHGTWNNEIAYYRNDGTKSEPRWTLVQSAYVTLTRGSNSTPALVDIDADGDVDLFVGESSGTLNYYRNDGTPQAPAFVLVTDEYGGIDVGRRSFPVFVDYDADGDADLVLGTDAAGLVYYRNDGTPQSPRFVLDESLAVPVPDIATPVFVDIDADGDLDLFSGGIGGGLVFFENVGR